MQEQESAYDPDWQLGGVTRPENMLKTLKWHRDRAIACPLHPSATDSDTSISKPLGIESS